jgi:hypothetical protein
MNRLKTIVLFVGILGIGLGAASLSGISATPLMVSAAPQTEQANFGMLGHVEYKVLDNDGMVKHYLQGDNVVVNTGMDCVARMVFENSTTAVCPQGFNEFQFIAIGNNTATGVVNATMSELDTSVASATGCAATGVSGEMARKQITIAPADFTASGASGTVVVLDTSSNPFDFDAGNATGNIFQSGIFDAGYGGSSNTCSGSIPTSSMFSVQDLNTDTGIAVSSGDSLSVKWTITVG